MPGGDFDDGDLVQDFWAIAGTSQTLNPSLNTGCHPADGQRL